MVGRSKVISTLPFAIVIVLLIFFGRSQFLTETPLHIDEARSGMRMMGTVDEIIRWHPPDWPPLHNVLLGGWSQITSEKPFSLRLFSALFSVLSVCLAYRMALEITRDKHIALGTMVIYGGLGISIYLGIFIRGYAMAVGLAPLAMYSTHRYFRLHQWRDAFMLVLTMGIMFISTYTSAFAFFMMGLFTLFLFPRQVWRWVIVGIMASPFVLVEFFRKQSYWLSRVDDATSGSRSVYDPIETIVMHFNEYVGQADIVWIALIVIAILLWVWKRQDQLPLLGWVIISCIAAPLLTFWLVENSIFVIMTSRYSWWAVIPLALGLAFGLRYLTTILWTGVMAIVLGLMITVPLVSVYYPFTDETSFYTETNMEWLSQRVQPNDVLIFDPNFCLDACHNQDELAYLWDAYLNERITRVNDPADHQRVWLWRGVGHSRELLQELQTTRIASAFIGPPESLIELYQAPPDADGVPYFNGMRFHGFEIMHQDGTRDLPPYDLREQTPITVRLWWSADDPIDDNYQVSFQIHDALQQKLVLQSDSAPQLIHIKENEFSPLPIVTSEWEPNMLYVDERVIISENLISEQFVNLYMIVYRQSDGERILAPDVFEDGMRKLDDSIIWGWG